LLNSGLFLFKEVKRLKTKKLINYDKPFGDRGRIQTCNLLIRSQMLYSVKLRSRLNNYKKQLKYFQLANGVVISVLRVQRYMRFLNYESFLKKNRCFFQAFSDFPSFQSLLFTENEKEKT
jgi:hypothetical protein